MSGRFTFKRTGTFSVDAELWSGSSLVDLTSITIASRITLSDGTNVDLTVTKAANQTTTGKGLYTVSYGGSCATWALGVAKFDVKYDDGSLDPTETIEVQVIEGVTP